jgi:hypothetical protein
MVDVLWKSFLTVVGIVVLSAVRYSNRVFNRNAWVAGEKTSLADIADENGNYLPGAKALIYIWIPFALVAMWADVPGIVVFVVLGVLIIVFNVYSSLIARRRSS